MTTNKKIKLRQRSLKELLDANFKKREWLVDPWFKQRMAVMVHAPTGVGKSWFTWSLALAIAGGGEFAGWKCPLARKVLIIDGEMAIEDLQERAAYLIEVMGLDSEITGNNLELIARQDQDVEFEFPDLDNPIDQKRFLTYIEKINPDVVVFDNLSTLSDIPDENSASAFNPILKFISKVKLERAVVVIHHDRKGTDKNSVEGYRGSSKMEAIFEQRISLSRVPEGSRPVHGGACFYLDFKKNRYLGTNDMKSRLFDLDPQNGWSAQADVDDVLKSVAEAVQSSKFVSQQELADVFGHQKAWAGKQIRKCVALGLLHQMDWANFSKRAKEIRMIDDLTDEDVEGLTPEELDALIASKLKGFEYQEEQEAKKAQRERKRRENEFILNDAIADDVQELEQKLEKEVAEGKDEMEAQKELKDQVKELKKEAKANLKNSNAS